MDIGAIFLTLAVLILVVMFVSIPFMHSKRRMVQDEHEISSLMAENERILDAVRELDFDNSLQKIPAEDYPGMRSALIQQGISIMRKLEENQQSMGTQAAESLLEAVIASSQVDQTMTPEDATEDEELEARIAKHRATHPGKSAGFCPKCGNPILVLDTFCPKCGNSLK
jgi:hypothetical protein